METGKAWKYRQPEAVTGRAVLLRDYVNAYLVHVAQVILSMAAWSVRCLPEGTS